MSDRRQLGAGAETVSDASQSLARQSKYDAQLCKRFSFFKKLFLAPTGALGVQIWDLRVCVSVCLSVQNLIDSSLL